MIICPQSAIHAVAVEVAESLHCAPIHLFPLTTMTMTKNTKSPALSDEMFTLPPLAMHLFKSLRSRHVTVGGAVANAISALEETT